MKRILSIVISVLLLTALSHCDEHYGLAGFYFGDQSAVAVTTVMLNCDYATDVNRTEAEREHARQVCETGLLYFAADLDKDREY